VQFEQTAPVQFEQTAPVQFEQTVTVQFEQTVTVEFGQTVTVQFWAKRRRRSLIEAQGWSSATTLGPRKKERLTKTLKALAK